MLKNYMHVTNNTRWVWEEESKRRSAKTIILLINHIYEKYLNKTTRNTIVSIMKGNIKLQHMAKI